MWQYLFSLSEQRVTTTLLLKSLRAFIALELV